MQKTLILLAALLTATLAMATPRQPKHITLPRLEGTPAPTAVMRHLPQSVAGSTIDLTSSIDYAQALYYTTGGNAYYTYWIGNYDDEVPAFQLETSCSDRTTLQGRHQVDLTYSWVTIDVDGTPTNLSLTSAYLYLQFVERNADGFWVYLVRVNVVASDGNTYQYSDTIEVYAMDKDDDFADIVLNEQVLPTSLSDLEQSPRTVKVVENGVVYILRNGQRYNLLGSKVE